MAKIAKVKKEKKIQVNAEEFLQENPAIDKGLKEISNKYIEDIHKFMSESTDVQLIVRVSFEFVRK